MFCKMLRSVCVCRSWFRFTRACALDKSVCDRVVRGGGVGRRRGAARRGTERGDAVAAPHNFFPHAPAPGTTSLARPPSAPASHPSPTGRAHLFPERLHGVQFALGALVLLSTKHHLPGAARVGWRTLGARTRGVGKLLGGRSARAGETALVSVSRWRRHCSQRSNCALCGTLFHRGAICLRPGVSQSEAGDLLPPRKAAVVGAKETGLPFNADNLAKRSSS